MKSLKDLRTIDLQLSSTDLYFSKVKELKNRKLDLEVENKIIIDSFDVSLQ